MTRILFPFLGAIVGVVVANLFHGIFTSSDWFEALMPPVPAYLGLALLVIAFTIAFARHQYSGFWCVAAWFAGVLVVAMLADSPPAPGVSVETSLSQLPYLILPWLFVASCALASLLNATVPQCRQEDQ